MLALLQMHLLHDKELRWLQYWMALILHSNKAKLKLHGHVMRYVQLSKFLLIQYADCCCAAFVSEGPRIGIVSSTVNATYLSFRSTIP